MLLDRPVRRSSLRAVDIEGRFRALLEGMPYTDVPLLWDAYQLAREAHAGQRRRHGTPYIEHPVDVVTILVQRCRVRTAPILAAALLHDVLEDTAVRRGELRRRFPARTVALVELLTDPYPRMSSDERRRYYRRIWADADASSIKIADRLSNLADCLLQPDPRFCARYAARTRNELLNPESPLSSDAGTRALVVEAIELCEERAARELPAAR